MDHTFLYSTDSTRIDFDTHNVLQHTTSDNVPVHVFYEEQPQSKPELFYRPLGTTALNADAVWLFSIVSIAGIIIGLIHSRTNNFITQLLSLTVSDFHWRSIVDSLSLQNRMSIFLLHASFHILLAAIIYEVIIATNNHNILAFNGIVLYLLILAATILFIGVKIFIHKLIGYTFDTPEIARHIIVCKVLATDIYAILALPIAYIFPFIPENSYYALTIIAAILLCTLYFWRLLKSVKIILTDYLSLIYTFLYLCTVEAIPIVCIYKLFTVL